MARYHCDKVSEQLQQIEGVRVTNITSSSWTFEQNGARINLRVLPGCCGVLLVYQISGKERDVVRLLKHVRRAAQKANFGLVLMTLRSDSRIRPLLEADTWVSCTFTNPRTNNKVEVLLHTVPPLKSKKKLTPQSHEDN